MAHTPQHPNNPCLLDENEQTPAKIWELLRRNGCFKKAVARLKELDRRPQLENYSPNRSPHAVGMAMVRSLGEIHAFAAEAIQWLVPDPLFEVRHVAIPAGVDLTGKEFVSLTTVKLEMGVTADPTDLAHWRTFEAQGKYDAERIANFNGRPWRRGPYVRLQKSEDPRFCDKVDPLREWRDYFANGRNFSLDTSWCDSPPQFKRQFCFLWRYLDSRAKNPITSTRIDAPSEHETTFFEGWSLLSRLAKNSIQTEDLARALEFDEIAKHYRVFAFPKSIRSRMEARRMAAWLVEQLCRLPDGSKLPLHEPEIYGTPIQWDVFLFAENCNDDSLMNAYRQTKPQIVPIERLEKWRKERLNYVEHFRAVERQVASVFPVKTPRPES